MGIFDWLKRVVSGRHEAVQPARYQEQISPVVGAGADLPGSRTTAEEAREIISQLGLKISVTQISRERLASNVDYPAVVTHQSLSRGTVETYDVKIDGIDDREESDIGNGEVFADWTFRGESRCHSDNAVRKKTFFASKCHSIIDGQTGEIISGRDATIEWLRRLIAKRQAAIAREQEADRNAAIRGLKDGVMAERLGRDVIVRYPVLGMEGFTDEVQEFCVTIDVMSRWHNTIRFYGKARRKAVPGKRAWTGVKSFYARDMVSLADPETGPVSDIEGYLEDLARLGPAANQPGK